MGGGIGGLLNLRQNGLDYAYLYDGKGNVGALIDDSQVPVAAYTYDTFGNLMSKTGTLNQPMQFSTKAYDEQTGLSYYGYRFYSPVLSRWITRDLIEEAGGLNLYGFAGINPVNRIDFFGLDDAAIQALQSQMDARANAFKNLVNNPDFKYPGLSPRGPLGVPGYVWRAGKLVKACYDAAEEVEKAKKEAEEKQKKEQAEKEFKKLLREKFGIEYVSAGASSGGP
jgi:RHS repeat-associated protein